MTLSQEKTPSNTLPTGAVSGLTGLKVRTIQRYVKRHPEGFSEKARQPRQGRRFTGQDIKTLMLIHRLVASKRGRLVAKAIRGEEVPPDLQVIEIENLIEMYAAVETLYKRAEKTRSEIQSIRDAIIFERARRSEKGLQDIDDELRELRRTLEDTRLTALELKAKNRMRLSADEIRELEFAGRLHRDELNPPEPTPRKRGIFG